MEQLRMICTLITVLAAAGGILWKLWVRFDAVVEGIRCQLRTDMLRVYYRHRDERTIRQYEKENFEHNYAAYTALGGNSFIRDIHDQVRTWEVVS